jgi:hypothetical protein
VPLYLVTCVCDEGVWDSSFRLIEAESRLAIARDIHRDPRPWRDWLEWSRVWRRGEPEEQVCPLPEELLRRIDASRVDGDSEWAFRIHEVKSGARLVPEPA